MALKEGSSGGVDSVDVKHALAAFQEMNKCALACRIYLEGSTVLPTLMLEIEAWEKPGESTEVKPLASQKWVVGSNSARTMEAAILQALYGLDAKLAEIEFIAKVKKA